MKTEIEAAGAAVEPLDRLATFFTADTMLASQFNDMRRAPVGDPAIHKLLLTVLEDGLRCFLGGVDVTDDDEPHLDVRTRRWKLREEAREWIFGGGWDTGPFSFTGLCEALGIDPAYLREKLQSRGRMRLPRRSPVSNRNESIGGRLLNRNALGRL